MLGNELNESFSTVFQETSKLSNINFNALIKIPHITNNQNYQDNYYSCDSPEEFYILVYIFAMFR